MKDLTSIKLNSYFVKKARKAAGHTQVSLAAEINKNEKKIKRIEQGQPTTRNTADEICKVLNVSLLHLQGQEEKSTYAPHYWCKSSSENSKEKHKDIGAIYHSAIDVTEYIRKKVNKIFYKQNQSPCKYEVYINVTLDKSVNTYTLNVISHHNSDTAAAHPLTQRFEIKPFRVDVDGMKWAEYNPNDNHQFETVLRGLDYGTAAFISDKCKEIEDPFYIIELKALSKYKGYHSLEQLNELDLSSFNLEDINNTINGNISMEELFIEDIYQTQFLFKTIESVESFLYEVIQTYQPAKIKRDGRAALLLKASLPSKEQDLSIIMGRVSLSQKEDIYWPWKHLSYFTKRLSKFPLNLDLETRYLSSNNLLEIAQHNNGSYSSITLNALLYKKISSERGLCN